MNLNRVKQTYLIGGVAVLVVALLSWFFLVSPRMAQAGEIGERRAVTEQQNAASEARIIGLTKQKEGLVDERVIANALAMKFPPTADQATLFRQVLVAAQKAGIPEKNITALGPAAPVLGGPSTGAKLPGGGAEPAADAGGKTDGGTKPAVAAKAAENMATMAISFNATGTYTQMIDMLKNLEDLPRSFLITQVNLSSGEAGKFTIAIQGNMYVHREIPDPEVKAVPKPAATPDAATPNKEGTVVTTPDGTTVSLAPGVTMVTPTPTP